MDIKRTVTISICGAQPRIGTTTQALQLVSYLQMMGYDAAYIELAEQGFIDQMRKLYRGISVDEGCVKYERIPMYRSIVDVNREEPYDFLVKDYGAMSHDDFNQVSYLEQDIKVICGGVKPNEIFEVNEILRKPEYHTAKFIFTFTPPDQKASITSLMENRARDTFFADYTPDPFSFDSMMNKNYRTIMGNYMTGVAVFSNRKTHVGKKVFVMGKNLLKKVRDSKVYRWIGLIIYTVILCHVFNLLFK